MILVALAGFGYAVKNFSALKQKGVGDQTDPYEYAHAVAVVGTIATAGMILQPLLMSIMRKPENEAEHANFKNGLSGDKLDMSATEHRGSSPFILHLWRWKWAHISQKVEHRSGVLD